MNLYKVGGTKKADESEPTNQMERTLVSGKPYGFAALTLLGLGIDTTRGSMPSAAPGCC